MWRRLFEGDANKRHQQLCVTTKTVFDKSIFFYVVHFAPLPRKNARKCKFGRFEGFFAVSCNQLERKMGKNLPKSVILWFPTGGFYLGAAVGICTRADGDQDRSTYLADWVLNLGL